MKNRGFTLVELMIVVAIIGIFAAVLFPLIFGHKTENGNSYGVPQQEPVTTFNETYRCQSGLLVKGNGEPMVQNGSAVKC